MTNEIVFFKSHKRDITLPVSVTDDTVWLSASQMAQLFERDESTIRKHIRNIFKEKELPRERNGQKMPVPFIFLQFKKEKSNFFNYIRSRGILYKLCLTTC